MPEDLAHILGNLGEAYNHRQGALDAAQRAKIEVGFLTVEGGAPLNIYEIWEKILREGNQHSGKLEDLIADLGPDLLPALHRPAQLETVA